MMEAIQELKVKIDKHTDDINNLKSDIRVIGNTVSNLTVEVDTLSSELHSLNTTIRDATVTLKTMVTLVKFVASVITIGSTLLGIYVALNA